MGCVRRLLQPDGVDQVAEGQRHVRDVQPPGRAEILVEGGYGAAGDRRDLQPGRATLGLK